MPTSFCGSGCSRVSATVAASPGQPGAVAVKPRVASRSIQGAHADAWIQRPWMRTTGGFSDMSVLLEVGRGWDEGSAAGGAEDDLDDGVGAAEHRDVRGVQLDGGGAGAGGHHALRLRRDRVVLRRDDVPGRDRAPGGDAGRGAE